MLDLRRRRRRAVGSAGRPLPPMLDGSSRACAVGARPGRCRRCSTASRSASRPRSVDARRQPPIDEREPGRIAGPCRRRRALPAEAEALTAGSGRCGSGSAGVGRERRVAPRADLQARRAPARPRSRSRPGRSRLSSPRQLDAFGAALAQLDLERRRRSTMPIEAADGCAARCVSGRSRAPSRIAANAGGATAAEPAARRLAARRRRRAFMADVRSDRPRSSARQRPACAAPGDGLPDWADVLSLRDMDRRRAVSPADRFG